jgi:hypothetical protein
MQDLKFAADTPQLAGGDALTIERMASRFKFEQQVDAVLAARIVDAINLMGGAGDGAESCYQRALDGLARQAKEVANALAVEYDRLDAAQYLDRWALVQLMGELKHEAALDFVDRLLAGRLPEERALDPEALSTVGEEVMIRTTAVDAVARMGSDGNARALEVLLRHVDHENFSVKRAAIQAFLAHGGEKARETLSQRLPERDHHIMGIQRVDVRQVPQAQGGLFLKTRDGRDSLPAHDLDRGDPDKPGHGKPHGGCGC